MKSQADVVIVGGGLAGLVAASELRDKRIRVVLVEQEWEQNLGGQAFWSFGGLFLVDSPQQRRMGIKDSYELALQDWMAAAGFDRKEDYWPKKWAEAYVNFAATDKYAWLKKLNIKFFPIVGWAERLYNSVPRFHVTWGTGPGVLEPFVQMAKEAEKAGILKMNFCHRVDELLVQNGAVKGIRGYILEESNAGRGIKSSRDQIAEFEIEAPVVILASGGFGSNHDLIRKHWPLRLGKAPTEMLSGVPAHEDGRILESAKRAGVRSINEDRMWHYTEGIKNWNPIWEKHGIRILPGPSSIWLDATGKRLPAPLFPGFDTLGTLQYLRHTSYDYSWFILTQKILKKEFALSGSEQNPDLTNKNWIGVLKRIFGKKGTPPVEAFKQKGEDFVVADHLNDLVDGMNKLTKEHLLHYEQIKQEIEARDSQLNNPFCKDLQIAAIRNGRNYLGDRFVRTAPLHKILDPKAGPLIAVKLHILTRKLLGGLETNLNGQVLNTHGEVIKGLYAAGEVAGFGGGGMHGYRALEGTFLGGCLFSGKIAGKSAAETY